VLSLHGSKPTSKNNRLRKRCSHLEETLAGLGVSKLRHLLAYKKSDLESTSHISLNDRRNIYKFLWKNFGIELKD
jgi:hypothetical protein